MNLAYTDLQGDSAVALAWVVGILWALMILGNVALTVRDNRRKKQAPTTRVAVNKRKDRLS